MRFLIAVATALSVGSALEVSQLERFNKHSSEQTGLSYSSGSVKSGSSGGSSKSSGTSRSEKARLETKHAQSDKAPQCGAGFGILHGIWGEKRASGRAPCMLKSAIGLCECGRSDRSRVEDRRPGKPCYCNAKAAPGGLIEWKQTEMFGGAKSKVATKGMKMPVSKDKKKQPGVGSFGR